MAPPSPKRRRRPTRNTRRRWGRRAGGPLPPSGRGVGDPRRRPRPRRPPRRGGPPPPRPRGPCPGPSLRPRPPLPPPGGGVSSVGASPTFFLQPRQPCPRQLQRINTGLMVGGLGEGGTCSPGRSTPQPFWSLEAGPPPRGFVKKGRDPAAGPPDTEIAPRPAQNQRLAQDPLQELQRAMASGRLGVLFY